ncbi:MAG: porphobilinogen synthase [Bacilli bacterium]
MFERHRRLRRNGAMRALVRETQLTPNDFIAPIFLVEGENIKNPIQSMPGVYQWSMDRVDEELQQIVACGIKAVILFGIPNEKDSVGSQAYNEEGIVQRGIAHVKATTELLVIADTCLCQFTDHGHCGVVHDGEIQNDASLTLLAQTAVAQAVAGADVIAPSNMMDGFVTFIRHALDDANFSHIPIMSYSVKYASSFYGPFRDAAHSAPQWGDRRAYQMDPSNRLEALREASADVDQGADWLMVKPALSYLDVIRELRDRFATPIVAYNVSGEYSMVKAAAQNGWIDEKRIVIEMLTSMKRAGADLIITYWAKDACAFLKEENQ